MPSYKNTVKEVNQVEESSRSGITVRTIFTAIKRNIILILLIIAVAIGSGFVYLHFKTPRYTAPEVVVYEGKNANNSSEVNNYNINYLFIETIVDFIDEGVVVDRANYYYVLYSGQKKINGDDYKVEDYIESVRKDDPYYKPTFTPLKEKKIVKENISVEAETDIAEVVKYSFVVKYTDVNSKDARDKVKLLILAADLESNEKVYIDNKEHYMYFDGIESSYEDYDAMPITTNISKKKTLLLTAVIGLALALVVVYIKTATDNTVKEKEELEQLLGADVLAIIEKTEGK
ncbi:MAG: hypothetical protein IJC07_04905 [Clostridia bacterium]|nr:hypothetical protein [Clostridia bacterium]